MVLGAAELDRLRSLGLRFAHAEKLRVNQFGHQDGIHEP